jgi:hypothetical protein
MAQNKINNYLHGTGCLTLGPVTRLCAQVYTKKPVKQDNFISTMCEKVDEFARVYSPHKEKARTNQKRKKKRPSIVPRVFTAIWSNLFHLGPPTLRLIFVPEPYPVVDWNGLARPNWKDRIGLPSPAYLPLHACSQNPNHYLASKEKDCLGHPRHVPPAFGGKAPFGEILGYRTSLGPVMMPTIPVSGHTYDAEENTCTISASPPPSSSPARGGHRGRSSGWPPGRRGR